MASPMENPQLTPLDVARFWSKVKVGNELECWLWESGIANNGYGEFKLNGKTVKAHRIAYFLVHGAPLTPSQHLMHVCDVRECVNPIHLRIGTPKSNHEDCIEKGRDARGSRNGLAKLTEEQVRDIRFAPMRAADLAKKYGVTASCIYQIRGGKNWTHVPLNNTVDPIKHRRRYWRRATA